LPTAQPSAAARKLGRSIGLAKPAAVVLAAAAFLGGSIIVPPLFWLWGLAAFFICPFLLSAFSKEQQIAGFRSALFDAEQKFNQANTDWKNRAGPDTFLETFNWFEVAMSELLDIPAKRSKAFEQLKQDHRNLQLDGFLDQFEIEDAKIDHIGPARKRTLESYGIETAADLVPNRISAVPGFGPNMVERLMKWRRSLEPRFIFDPKKAIDPRAIFKVEQQIETRRGELEAWAKLAYSGALQAHARIVAVRQSGRLRMEALAVQLAQAKVDYEYVRG
jgi:DNA-binding helix-hairpin-helix protein with protein kinase domain